MSKWHCLALNIIMSRIKMYFQDIRQSIGFVFVVLMSFGLLCMGNRMLPRKSILSEIEIRLSGILGESDR